MTWHSVHLLQI